MLVLSGGLEVGPKMQFSNQFGHRSFYPDLIKDQIGMQWATCCWALSMKFVWHVGEVELLEVVVNTAVVLPSDELRLLLPV